MKAALLVTIKSLAMRCCSFTGCYPVGVYGATNELMKIRMGSPELGRVQDGMNRGLGAHSRF